MDQIQRRLREGIFILALAVSSFLLIALFTYHHADAAWSHIDLQPHVQNAGGVLGAWLADVLLYTFGYIAYFFPIMLSYSAWLAMRESNLGQAKFYFMAMRLGGTLLILLGACGLFSIQIMAHQQNLPFTSGGIIGQVMMATLIALFNIPGAVIILLTALLLGLTLFGGVSWLTGIEAIGKVTSQLLSIIRSFCRHLVWRDEENIVTPPTSSIATTKTKSRVKPVIELVDREEEEEIESLPETMRMPIKPAPMVQRPLSATKPHHAVKPEPPKRTAREALNSVFSSTVTGCLPSLNLLDRAEKSVNRGYTTLQLEEMSRKIEQFFLDFNVEVNVVSVHPGPVITRFEMELGPGIKVNQINNLSKDLARSLLVTGVRVVEIIAGKSVVGLEVPNQEREVVRLSEVLASKPYEQATSPLVLALGKDIAGHPVVVDLAKMPHLLVAGTTGSGKSVGLNAMLLSLLFKTGPDNVRLILIDPKMLELSVYEGIPHLLAPVVTDMKEAASALRWCVAEMERRYRLMAALGVRNIAGFNAKLLEAAKQRKTIADPLWRGPDTAPPLDKLPFVVVVIDELADMMMVVGKKVEQLIARIAQKARASGIHLILATQRPSVDVITGLIKSNIPTRIAFQVSSRIDSRTILDQQGAEHLLGHGDMLYLAPGTGLPIRVHGAFVDDQEVHRVAEDWKRRGEPVYIDAITQSMNDGDTFSGFTGDDQAADDEQDTLYDQAVAFVLETRRASISSVQRRFKIGYNRAARLVEAMQRAGLVSSPESNGSREILVPALPDED